MQFSLLRYGPKHLEVESDDHRKFLFAVQRNDCGQRDLVLVKAAHCETGPGVSSLLMQEASRFASVCAEDFGLR